MEKKTENKMNTTPMGRPVRIISIGFTGRPEDCTPMNPYPLRRLDEMVGYIESCAGVDETDMILLPEFWPGASVIQDLEGEVITEMRRLAARYRTYMICPISRKTENIPKLNSAVLIDRQGEIVGVYDKHYPFWSEYDIDPAPAPGQEIPVFDTDFGRIGMAICFDANFPDVWDALGRQGAEIVFWPSAYSAGTQLQAHALNHNYYIVTATTAGDCLAYDINGQEILYECSPDVNITRLTLDLDRCIFHDNFNIEALEKLIQDHGDEVEIELRMPKESWFILRTKQDGVPIRPLADQYGLTGLRAYKYDSQFRIDSLRNENLRSLTPQTGTFYDYLSSVGILAKSCPDVFRQVKVVRTVSKTEK